jgi:predicted phage terminase large subunit-like protein
MEVYGKKVFNVELAVDTAAASMWDIRYHAGGMEALGSGSSVQGRGANLLIMDDLVAGYEMASNPLLLHRQWEWFLTDVYPRLEPGASAIILNTRWALDDMIGMIKKAQSEEGLFLDWESVNFPAISTGVNDPLGRPAGEALFPERFPVKRLEAIKKHMMAQGQDEGYWEALYQGNPVAPRGTIVDINWIQRYEHSDIPGPGERDKWEMLVISADTASKETELADFTVIGIWGVLNSQYFLLNIIREKMPWPELVTTCKTLQGVYRPDFFLVEDKGSGISLIQEMRQDQMYNVWPMNPGSENKVIRLQAETPVLRAGKVWVPKSAPWVDEFLLELRAFPRGRRDQADMMSQFLKFFRQAAGGVQMF